MVEENWDDWDESLAAADWIEEIAAEICVERSGGVDEMVSEEEE